MVIRPVERGPVPKDESDKPKTFRVYTDAFADLVERIGGYCSYCERRIPVPLAVEHILPKSKHPDLELAWDNFLLGCTNCNSVKKDKDIALTDYYWPHLDNTARAFEYRADGRAGVHANLTPAQRKRAERTLKLTGLDRHPASPNSKPTPNDRRWLHRSEAWEIAQRSLERLQKNDTLFMREEIVEHAQAQGFWSVWMTVFQDDLDMLNRFIVAFPGTCKKCFNKKGEKVRRPGGAI